jgi:hypothetical protein
MIMLSVLPGSGNISVSQKLNSEIIKTDQTVVLNFIFTLPEGEHVSSMPEPKVELKNSSLFVIDGEPEVKPAGQECLDPEFGVKVKLKLKNPQKKGKLKIEGCLTYFHCSSKAKTCMISEHNFSTRITVK